MISGKIAFSRVLQLQPFLDLFEQRGGNRDAVLESAGIAHLNLADPTTLISGNALYKVVHEMAEALDDPYFTARAAEAMVKAGHGFVRESYEASRTLAEFLPLAVLELDRQISNIRYSIQINADYAVIRAERTFRPVAPIAQADAGVTSMWVTFLRLVVAEEFDPSCIVVMAQRDDCIPPDLVPPSSFLKRNWNGVQILFPSEWLRRPLVLDWDFPLTRRGKFEDTPPRQAILDFMESVCFERIGERTLGVEDFARRLGLHPKNLQRTLARLGTSVTEIRDNARQKRALEILAMNKLTSNEEIAESLGFSSAASFSRAFKRWTGVTPSEYRNCQ